MKRAENLHNISFSKQELITRKRPTQIIEWLAGFKCHSYREVNWNPFENRGFFDLHRTKCWRGDLIFGENRGKVRV